MKRKIVPENLSPQRVFAQDGGGVPRRRGKKILLISMVAASIGVVAAWAVFTIKPSWFAEVKTHLPFTGAPKDKRSPARYPSRPVFKVVQPQRTNPLPPSTPPMMAEQMQRPQTSPSGISPTAPPSAYPETRPRVSPPGAAGIPPSVPPSTTYPSTRPEVAVPGAPGIAPTIPPSSTPPFPGEVDRPPAGTSSGQGATSGFSPNKKEDSESDEYLEIATLYAQKGKYQKVEELFQKVAKENPSSAKVHNNLGVVRLKQEKYDMAEREFKEALRLEPAFVLPYYNLACLYSKKGVNVEALIYLKKALKRDERVKQWVRTDKDFDRLRSDVVFQELMGSSPGKKEGAKKTEGTQKPGGGQKQESVRQQEGPLKKEEAPKQETQTQEKAPKTSPSKKEEIPPQAGPLQPVPPKQEEMQKQGVPPAGPQSQSPSQGDAHNQEGTKGGAQNQQGTQGGAVQ
ncbi:MAG: tetratricopeptide repeat protein [Deltaproteobacteria bacterium]|nr:tetratricopeptide repeat protein [Deltaproteobacteria bacterium]